MCLYLTTKLTKILQQLTNCFQCYFSGLMKSVPTGDSVPSRLTTSVHSLKLSEEERDADSLVMFFFLLYILYNACEFSALMQRSGMQCFKNGTV